MMGKDTRIISCKGNWTVEHGVCPVNNFNYQFNILLEKAVIEEGEFHDLRGTYLTRMFIAGLSEYEVMKLAGHADFETTHRFYLAIRDDLQKRARRAIAKSNFIAKLLQVPFEAQKEKSRQSQVLDGKEVKKHPRQDSNL